MMTEMIKYEYGKIWGRRIVVAGVLFMLFMNFMSFAGRENYDHLATADGRLLQGEEAKAYIGEHTQKYAGLLNDEKKDQILIEEKPAEVNTEYYYGIPLYDSINENFAQDHGPFYGKTVDEVFTKKGVIVEVGNASRWVDYFQQFQAIVMILGVVVAMGLSGVFSEEYGRKTDALILTSRHGKKRCVWAKIIAAYLFTFTCYTVMLLTDIVLILISGGLEGWNAGVQLDCFLGLFEVPYTLSCGAAAIWLMVGGALAMIMLTAVTLVLSALAKTPFVSVILAETVYLLPQFAGTFIPFRYLAPTPGGAATVAVLTFPRINIAGLELMYYTKIAVIAVILAVIAAAASRRIFAGHEVR